MSDAIEAFWSDVPQAALDDLRARLTSTRWPDRETVADWSQGVPLQAVRGLCHHWATAYDWRRCEARLNAAGQYRTRIDGLDLHFLHVRSPNPHALPLILTHGWPGSVIEFLDVLGPLTEPAAHGGDPDDAFHVVVPSLPGFGFSGKPAEAGWGVDRIALAWIALMGRLDYTRYVAQGGDWGAAVTTSIGAARPPGCVGIHLNMPIAFPESDDLARLTPAEQASVATMRHYRERGSGYARQQGTRPQTLGYALTDSPAGQAAWIYEKYQAWTDNDGTPESALPTDAMLDNITLYWLTETATSSARLYWESLDSFTATRIEIPVGVSIFPKEIFRPSRRWAERSYPNLVYWNELDRGGHFAAFERPADFVNELRRCFGHMR